MSMRTVTAPRAVDVIEASGRSLYGMASAKPQLRFYQHSGFVSSFF
jgi:hypothetical protein